MRKMIQKILNISRIDMNNPEIRAELEIDLKRMDKMSHILLEGCDAYRVRVMPSLRTYMDGLYRFRFEIQYGLVKGNEFMPIGETVFCQTESLPMI